MRREREMEQTMGAERASKVDSNRHSINLICTHASLDLMTAFSAVNLEFLLRGH